MPRFLLVVALAVLPAAGCTVAPHSPEATHAAVAEAVRAGAGGRALRRLRQAAAAGDLYALRDLSVSLGRGYVSASPAASAPAGALHAAVWAVPGEAWLRRRQLDRALARGVARRDTAALLLVAERLLYPSLARERWAEPTAAARDSARALLAPLAETGYWPAGAQLAQMDGFRTPAGQRWVQRAVEAGDARACWFNVHVGPDRLALEASAGAVARALDGAVRCRALGAPPEATGDPSAGFVDGLRRLARQGDASAAARLDSLDALGVFERHPGLAAGRARP